MGRGIDDLRQRWAAAPTDEAALVALCAALDAARKPGTPQEAVARSNRAEMLRRQGRLPEAEAEHRAAQRWLPGFGGIRFNLGVVLMDQGRVEEAAAAFTAAAERMPTHAPSHAALAAALQVLGRTGPADIAYAKALTHDPSLAAVWINRGNLRRESGHLPDAAADYRRALALQPANPPALANLGLALREEGDIAAAIAVFDRALRLGMDDQGGILAQLIQQKRHLCRWDGLPELSARLVALVRDGMTTQVPPWIFLGEGAGRDLERVCAQAYSAWRTAGITAFAPLRQPRTGTRRPRIAYLSSDFQEHATAVLIAELIERHDHDAFEFIAYSYGLDDGGPLRRRLRGAFDRFVDVERSPAKAIASALRGDKIDILVDLKGHTQGARPEILAYRPARVQLTWLGYPGTTGLPGADGIIVDSVVAPASHARAYSERLLHLPCCYQPTDATRVVGPAPQRAACGLPDEAVVLCCFNAAYKINPTVFALWMRILRAVPQTILWLLESHPEAAANLRTQAARQNVDPERLVFAPRRPMPEYLAQYRIADLFLDTFPVGAHTTASDALWAGLPVVTVLGDSFAGRVGASLLRAAGLPELAMGSVGDYEAAVLRLAQDDVLRRALRTKLNEERAGASLWDAAGLARALEKLYRDALASTSEWSAGSAVAIPS